MRGTTALFLLPLGLMLAAAAPSPTPGPVDLAVAGRAAFMAKCGTCHGLDRPMGATKDTGAWGAVVARMVAKSPTLFSAGDQTAITAYLAGRSLFLKACTTCHGADRSEGGRLPAAWKATIARMQQYAKGKIGDGDAALILGFLVAEHPAKP